MVDLSKKSERAKLTPRREPYWHRVSKGAYIGYRVSLKEGEGTWIARFRSEDGEQHYKALGRVPNFDDAKKEAERWFEHFDKTLTRDFVTVSDCCRAYVTEKTLLNEAKNAKDAEGRFKLYVYETELGRLTLDRLRSWHVRDWRDGIKAAPGTVNRNLSVLLAALNFAHRSSMVADDSAWVGISKLKEDNEGKRRQRWLTSTERRALLDACSADLRSFCEALLLTAARPGEVASCKVSDFNKHTGTLRVSGKTGTRTLPLPPAIHALCSTQSKAKLPSAWLFCTDSGDQWGKGNWTRPFKAAREAAGFGPDVVLYTLRHSAITEMIMAGVNAFTVASFAGTSTKMIDEHYGHLCPNGVASEMDSVNIL